MSALVVSWGGGVNSTALLVGLQERGITPDAILFADTGGEKPETYAYRETVDAWLSAVGLPTVTVVQKDGPTLEDDCLTRQTLPSIAFGFKSCSDHYKRRPQHAWLKARYADLSTVTLAIGIDAGEAHRATRGTEVYARWFPLIEWGWDRAACVAAIQRAGLPVPPKSACFFCPSSKRREVISLNRTHPDLMERALTIEDGASAAWKVKGLGRSYAWRNLIDANEAQVCLFPESPDLPCGCFDGGDE